MKAYGEIPSQKPPFGNVVEGLLETVLLDPVRNLMERPSKRIRAELVELGVAFAGASISEPLRRQCEDVMESVHAGSLAIDDIQDDSQLRRGQPTLHRRYGVPLAINTGNWLYFQPLEQVRQMNLTPERELQIYRTYHRALLQAHYGQALDVGVRIDTVAQKQVYEVCLTSLELKSGMLTSLALALGAIAGGGDKRLVDSLEQFGCAFGVALQMFDDLGNLSGKKDPDKKWEDLRLRRPSWFWAWAARNLNEVEYADFVEQVRQLPKTDALEAWLVHHSRYPKQSLVSANEHLDNALKDLEVQVCSKTHVEAMERLKSLAGRLRVAYE